MKLRRLADAAGSMKAMWGKYFPGANRLANERGDRLASDDALQRLYTTMWLDTERRAMIQTVRDMDIKDGRVKRVHARIARDCVRGGLVFQSKEPGSADTLKREWEGFKGRLQLDTTEKLKSDARGLAMEGNLPLQLVLDDANQVVAAIRMPSDTIVPITDMGGRFKNPAAAYEQRDVMTGRTSRASRPGSWQCAAWTRTTSTTWAAWAGRCWTLAR